MASRKRYRASYYKKFITRSDYRKRLYESYKKQYRKVAEVYGANMNPMYTYEAFTDAIIGIAEYRGAKYKEVEYTLKSGKKTKRNIYVSGGVVVSSRYLVSRQIEDTYSESRSAISNMENNFSQIMNKNRLSDKEARLVNYLNENNLIKIGDNGKIKLKLSIKDIRRDSAKWKELYSFMKNDLQMSNQVMGS